MERPTDRGRALFAVHHALVGSSVRVRLLHDQTAASGVLYGIDPESGDAALLVAPEPDDSPAANGRKLIVKIVLGHAIDAIELDEDAGGLGIDTVRATLAARGVGVESATKIDSDLEVAQLAQQLRSFLDERFIPHAPHSPSNPRGVVVVLGGAATLRFPFRRDCVDCANEQILRRLQTLMDSFHGEASRAATS